MELQQRQKIMAKNSTGFVLAVDVGTTNVTCHVFDSTGISKYGASRKVYTDNFDEYFLQLKDYNNRHRLNMIQLYIYCVERS